MSAISYSPPEAPVGLDEAQAVRGRHRVSPIEWAALAAGLLPIAIVCVWALVERWVPLGDSGQLVVRSRDVLTANHPFVGSWSSSSTRLSSNVNNLGSLYSILLAPFTRIEPYAGTAVGMTVINGASIVGVWAAARSLFGRIGAVGAMLATLALIASLGAVSLLQTRQQLALLMPFWCLLWVTAALWRGRVWAAPAVVFLFSLTTQTHFTLVYQSAAIALAGTLAFILSQRARFSDRTLRRPLYLAAVVGALCWAQPLWDQFFRQGNLGNVLRHSGGTPGSKPGLDVGAEILSHAGLRPPFWLPGSMGHFDSHPVALRSTSRTAWLALGLWFVVVAVTWLWARRTQRAGVAALAGVAGVALASGLFAASQMPPTFYIYPAQNYYWMWPVVLLLCLAPAAALASAVRRRPLDLHRRRAFAGLAIGALLAATVVGSIITSHIDGIAQESFDQRDNARSFLSQVSAGLRAHHITGAVFIDYSAGSLYSAHRYTFLAELQRRHVPFVFDPASADVYRFGFRRCANRSLDQSIAFRTGASARKSPRRGAVLLGRIDASSKQYATLHRLDATVARKLRTGEITANLGAMRRKNRSLANAVGRLLHDSNRPATNLAAPLLLAQLTGEVHVPRSLLPLMEQWRTANDAVEANRVALYLVPGPTGKPAKACP